MNREEQQKRKQEQWDALPEIYVRLHKDTLGYPPKEWEQLKAEATAKPDVFRIKNIPHYARGLAWEDEVATRSQTFTYDALNRLISARNAGTDCSQPVLGGLKKFWGNSYVYDA